MHTGTRSAWVAATLGMVFGMEAAAARAQLSACDDIFVVAQAECEVVPPSAQCEAMCTPITVRAECSAQLAAECRGGCDELPSIDCTAECTGGCMASCENVDPGEFDCSGECRVDCSGRCEAECASDSDGAACQARCEGSCSASCDARCDARPPSADCEASCKASCEGSCEVQPNLDCQIKCQTTAEGDCVADIQGECQADCMYEEGALFCDGSFVDHGDNLDDCIDALRAKYEIRVDASGQSSCEGNECSASGEVSASSDGLCTVANPGTAGASTRWLGAMLLMAALAMARRRPRVRLKSVYEASRPSAVRADGA